MKRNVIGSYRPVVDEKKKAIGLFAEQIYLTICIITIITTYHFLVFLTHYDDELDDGDDEYRGLNKR